MAPIPDLQPGKAVSGQEITPLAPLAIVSALFQPSIQSGPVRCRSSYPGIPNAPDNTRSRFEGKGEDNSRPMHDSKAFQLTQTACRPDLAGSPANRRRATPRCADLNRPSPNQLRPRLSPAVPPTEITRGTRNARPRFVLLGVTFSLFAPRFFSRPTGHQDGRLVARARMNLETSPESTMTIDGGYFSFCRTKSFQHQR